MDITLKNYRCFEDALPLLRFPIRGGFTGILGANNSGKSTILKFFYEFRNLFRNLSEPQEFNQYFLGDGRAFRLPDNIFEYEEMFSNRNTRDLIVDFDFEVSDDSGASVHVTLTVVVQRLRQLAKASAKVNGHPLDAKSVALVAQSEGMLVYKWNDGPELNLKQFLDEMRCLASGMYIGPFRNIINVGSNDSYFDVKCGQAFITEWHGQKHGNISRIRDEIYNVCRDIRHIFDYDDFDVDASADGRSLDVRINGKGYKLPEIGAGLTQFIFVLGTASITRPSYIFIDEPELNLHPSLQLDFLTSLASYASEGLIFSTHSYGLARSVAERVLVARLIEPGLSHVTPLEATPRLSELLGELSFSGYKELGFDAVLLVEGRTEVKTYQQFLRQLHKDHKVVLLPLGGRNMISEKAMDELEEIKRISENVYAIVDSEKSSEKEPLGREIEGFARICSDLKIPCLVLEKRATEHYLVGRAVQVVKGAGYRELLPYEKRETVIPVWPKEENWKIAREMRLEEFAQTDLGKFLAAI